MRIRLLLISVVALMSVCARTAAQPCVGWRQIGLSGVNGLDMAYESGREVTVMVRPGPYGVDWSQTWEWDGEHWRFRTNTGPSSRIGHTMDFDAARGETVLFGGYTFFTPSSETWLWNGDAWTLATSSGPPPAGNCGMTYDSDREVIVMKQAGTWEWNGESWTLRSMAGPVNAPIAYDPLTKLVISYGGAGPGCCGTNYTWEYDGLSGAWRDRTNPDNYGIGGHRMVFDPALQKVIRWGGDPFPTLRAWNGDHWISPFYAQSTPNGVVGRTGFGLVYDSAREVMVLFGGFSAPGTYLNDTWELHTETGVFTEKYPLPWPSDTADMVYDTIRKRTVMYVGIAGVHWEYDAWAEKWHKRTETGPVNRQQAATAFDQARGVTVLFGGKAAQGNQSFDDTWEWDGEQWIESPVFGPAARHGHAMAYDSARKVTIMFGGIVDNALNNETWEYDGNEWTLRATDGPLARSDHGFVFDSARGVSVLFAGRGPGTGVPSLLSDTWEWDGSSWTLVSEDAGPPARKNHGMAFDSNRGVSVVYGGLGAYDPPHSLTPIDDMWEWDGKKWIEIFQPFKPGNRHSIAMSFDSDINRIQFYGGSDIADLWEYGNDLQLSYQPAAIVPARLGERVSLTVTVQSASNASYQWLRDDEPLADGGSISGAMSSTLTIDPAAPTDAGFYACIITNECGSIRSTPGRLKIIIPCPADIADPSTREGDGQVGIDDLFAVLAAWGPCPQPCTPGEDCPADIVEDCQVNVDDLFAVIAAWGPCP